MTSLKNKTLQYLYSDGGRVVLTFADDTLGYEWINGPFKGVAQSGLKYSLRQTGSGDFVVAWHDKETNNYVTLIIVLSSGRVYSPGILGYSTPEETTISDEAEIESAT